MKNEKSIIQEIKSCGMTRERLAWKSGVCTRTIQRVTTTGKCTAKTRDKILFAIRKHSTR